MNENPTTRRELANALETWTADGSEAFILVDKMFGCVRSLLHQLNPDLTFLELDLRLADLQRDAREELYDLLHNTVDRDVAVDIIAVRFFGED
jgi:hypothetical protein